MQITAGGGLSACVTAEIEEVDPAAQSLIDQPANPVHRKAGAISL